MEEKQKKVPSKKFSWWMWCWSEEGVNCFQEDVFDRQRMRQTSFEISSDTATDRSLLYLG